MTVLSSKKILQEKNTTDPNSITSLTLTHKALSDVSCLSEFKNLERLDLGFNSLTSLEDLKSCVNLKWLSVVQNKLQSLKGIESLTNLTVLNAGKNKLKSMDEVKSLGSLRALILNDNEITSVCKLDQMKELNTLVLSRNPIRSLGESLVKLKSITKLSLSNCQLQTVDSSLKSCLELKELRLSHNEIMSIPSEFGHFMKLQNLDVGNNWITNWSNLKVLSSLVNLRNLNLQGNPVAEKENLLKKVKKLLPNLHIFNSRPIEKISAKEVHGKVDDFSVEEDNKSTLRSKSKADHLMRDKKSSKFHPVSETMDGHLDNAGDLGSRNKRKEPHDEKGIDSANNADTSENKKKKNYTEALDVNTEKEKKQKLKKQKDRQPVDEPVKKSRKTLGGDHKVNMIDTADTPFMDLFTTSAHEVALKTTNSKLDQGFGVVVLPKKKTKKNRAVDPASLDLSQVDEIGLGGPSAW